jgi:hypothetical protein
MTLWHGKPGLIYRDIATIVQSERKQNEQTERQQQRKNEEREERKEKKSDGSCSSPKTGTTPKKERDGKVGYRHVENKLWFQWST